MEKRKTDHIEMALNAQTTRDTHDNRFHYEPMLKAHPQQVPEPLIFLGKSFRVPLWVSSMTGGATAAGKINHNLAMACRTFGMGMGLGSCRVLLHDTGSLSDFDLRDTLGDDLPLYANLGISQVEQLLQENKIHKIHDLVSRLRADGLIIHINPLQEWFQPEGDRFRYAPLDTVKNFLDKAAYPVIVKEVGQGMGPASLAELFRLPLAAVEFGAFGGTNFSKVELQRNETGLLEAFEPFLRIGEKAEDMVDYVNSILLSLKNPACREVIISGGIKNFLEGYYLIKKIKTPAVYGQASSFLRYAKESYEALHAYVQSQVTGLMLANAYLTVKE
jgi:isopentenyl-diphosphate delta-isomerase